MKTTKTGDFISGTTLAGLGIVVSIYSLLFYQIGTFAQMGSGMFPLLLGILLVVLGAIIAINALLRSGEVLVMEPTPAAAILGGGVAFGLIVDRLGIFPAVMAAVLIASLASRSTSWTKTLIFAVVLAIISVTIFRGLLHLPIPAFSWKL